jgi:hypothetical protein
MGIGYSDPHFLDLCIFEGERSASCPCRFTLGESARGTHWIGCCVDHRACLDNVEERKFLILQGRELCSLVAQTVVSRCTDSAVPAHTGGQFSRILDLDTKWN